MRKKYPRIPKYDDIDQLLRDAAHLEYEDLLWDYLDRNMPASKMTEQTVHSLERHLKTCDRCQALLKQIGEIKREPASDASLECIFSFILDHKEQHEQSQRSQKPIIELLLEARETTASFFRKVIDSCASEILKINRGLSYAGTINARERDSNCSDITEVEVPAYQLTFFITEPGRMAIRYEGPGVIQVAAGGSRFTTSSEDPPIELQITDRMACSLSIVLLKHKNGD